MSSIRMIAALVTVPSLGKKKGRSVRGGGGGIFSHFSLSCARDLDEDSGGSAKLQCLIYQAENNFLRKNPEQKKTAEGGPDPKEVEGTWRFLSAVTCVSSDGQPWNWESRIQREVIDRVEAGSCSGAASVSPETRTDTMGRGPTVLLSHM